MGNIVGVLLAENYSEGWNTEWTRVWKGKVQYPAEDQARLFAPGICFTPFKGK